MLTYGYVVGRDLKNKVAEMGLLHRVEGKEFVRKASLRWFGSFTRTPGTRHVSIDGLGTSGGPLGAAGICSRG